MNAKFKVAAMSVLLVGSSHFVEAHSVYTPGGLDKELDAVLAANEFTGKVGSTLQARLGRNIDTRLADLGRKIWFDSILGLNNDNSCSGCHSPTNGFGDTQSIAIGIENNGIVGPDRRGPRNQRRTPMAINTAFFPTLMWNSRFRAISGNPFDSSQGLQFPDPEALELSNLPHLLTAQAFIPPTERVEAAGFTFPGDPSDAKKDHDMIRGEVIKRLNDIPAYRHLFGMSFPEVRRGANIDYQMLAKAIAEFEFTLVFANAPIDRYARGQPFAMSTAQKRGALLFFGKANCVSCHAVSGNSNEMFSDFKEHVVGVPQVVPDMGNVTFDGPGANEDFGLEQVSGKVRDRYKFRTSPLRNVALQAAFFHNGAYTRLEDAIRHHLDATNSARAYSPTRAGVASDLRGPQGPIEPVLAALDAQVVAPTLLSPSEINDLIRFVGEALLDKDAKPERLMRLIPQHVPSGRPVAAFQSLWTR